LEFARGNVAGQALPRRWLVWSSPVVEVNRAALKGGERVVSDFTITDCRAPDGVDTAETRERVTLDPDEVGVVYAWDGRAIGAVKPGRKGGAVLEFTWPEGLARSAPPASARS
jgi:hypothetical protein